MIEKKVKQVSTDVFTAVAKSDELLEKLCTYYRDEKQAKSFINNALRMKFDNPRLATCTRTSIYVSLLAIAEYDLSLTQKEVYLIPRRNECTLMLGYKGLIALAYRSGEVATVYAETVHEGDEFKVTLGTTQEIIHSPALDKARGPQNLTHVYAICHLKNGSVLHKVMSKAELDIHRAKHSPARGGASAWETSFLMMAQKTVLKQVLNTMPKAVRPPQALDSDPVVESSIDGQCEPQEENILELSIEQ